MPSTKTFKCVHCGETDISKFYMRQKSLCKIHYNLPRTQELRKKILKPYCCVICGDDDESHFHVYKKTKCKKHYNTKIPLVNLKSSLEDQTDCENENILTSYEEKFNLLPIERNVASK